LFVLGLIVAKLHFWTSNANNKNKYIATELLALQTQVVHPKNETYSCQGAFLERLEVETHSRLRFKQFIYILFCILPFIWYLQVRCVVKSGSWQADVIDSNCVLLQWHLAFVWSSLMRRFVFASMRQRVKNHLQKVWWDLQLLAIRTVCPMCQL
jgi:hypothetical protein